RFQALQLPSSAAFLFFITCKAVFRAYRDALLLEQHVRRFQALQLPSSAAFLFFITCKAVFRACRDALLFTHKVKKICNILFDSNRGCADFFHI
ncbi:hypothetical protein, partial [Paenibacillus sp. N3.4]|uniref:hypothetical protein n=1 Tax=Paenibacillus sp. N3.4 TaxID=2603222 RepID=UPI001C9D28FE